MANSAEVMNDILIHPPPAAVPIAYNFLVPNMKGLENFLSQSKIDNPTSQKMEGIDEPAPLTSTQNPNEMPSREASVPIQKSLEISIFTAATEAFSKTNTNCTIQ